MNLPVFQPRFAVTLILFGLFAISGCKTVSSPNYTEVPNKDFPYSFDREPFINPNIFRDLDRDQVVAINVLDSRYSDDYKADVQVNKIEGQQNPYIYSDATSFEEGDYNITEFGYEFVGRTSSGIYVIKTSDCEGGSGVFMNLLFVKFLHDQSLDCDLNKTDTGLYEDRLIVKKLGEISLGDRWDGKLAINGNAILIGKDNGLFANNTNDFTIMVEEHR